MINQIAQDVLESYHKHVYNCHRSCLKHDDDNLRIFVFFVCYLRIIIIITYINLFCSQIEIGD